MNDKMNKSLKISAIVFFIISIGVIFFQNVKIKKLKEEKNRYKNNTEVLLSDAEMYKTKDSLNVASVEVLELKLKEYKKYRSEDLKVIETLKNANRSIESVLATQTKTIMKLKGNIKDSIVIIPGDTVVKKIPCLRVKNNWIEINGCVDDNKEFTGELINNDSLIITKTVKYKRFLGFLWKTKKVKDSRIDVVSKNPYTKILGVEYIEIKK